MKALTICQPYASLIINPPHRKRVENRSWPTSYRGLLAIHAGRNKQWLRTLPEDEHPEPMPMGAVIGVADLTQCVRFDEREAFAHSTLGPYDWLVDHPHASGPFCWILERIQVFHEPIPCSGAQGLWQWEPPADWRARVFYGEW